MATPGLNIESLSPEERLELIERLWDSLIETPEKIPVTKAQREELDRRLDDYERDPSPGAPWEEIRERILGRDK